MTDYSKFDEKNPGPIAVRRCCMDDIYDVWVWWNDPHTRSMMEKKHYVSLQEHMDWFNSVLHDPSRVLCMGLIENVKIGVVRFDARDNNMTTWEVSINLNPAFRGRQLGWQFLSSSISFFRGIVDFSRLYANVGEPSNVPSQRTFLKAGFLLTPDQKYKFHYELRNVS